MKQLLTVLFLLLLASTAAACRQAAIESDPQDALITFCTPYDDDAAEQKALDLINGAHHKIRVCAYGFTDLAICDALIDAQERGVDVSVVMDSTQAGGPHQMPLVRKLKRHEIPVAVGKSEKHSQLIHAKFIVVDDAIVESGSWNYSGQTASDQDNFLDFIVSDKRAAMFTDFWNKIHAHISGSD